MEYKVDVDANFDNSFCMDSDCIHYMEDSCMLFLCDTGDLIFPDSTVYLKERESSLCKQFSYGNHLIYVLDDIDAKEGEG